MTSCCRICRKAISDDNICFIHNRCAEPSIPISKIEARIKEIEDSPAPNWVGRWEILDAMMEELENLLPSKEKEKEKPK